MAIPKFTQDALSNVGVDLLDIDKHILQCKYCKTKWWWESNGSNRFPRAWYKCPKRCYPQITILRAYVVCGDCNKEMTGLDCTNPDCANYKVVGESCEHKN